MWFYFVIWGISYVILDVAFTMAFLVASVHHIS